MTKPRICTIGMVTAAFLSGAATGSGAESPRFTTLDVPGATMTQAWSISPRGEIAGYYSKPDSSQHGFLYSGGVYASIDYPGAGSTQAFGINARGDVVGVYSMGGITHGFLFSGGRYTGIDYPGAERTEAAGINARGDIVGVQVTGGVSRGFLLRGSEYSSIQYPGATATVANGLNDQGEVVGGYALGGVQRGFVLKDGKFTSIEHPAGNFTGTYGLNPAGEIVGRYRDSGNVNHAFVLSGGVYTVFDYPGASFTGAASINPAGDVVGRYTVNGITHGLLVATARQQRYRVTDLGTLGGDASGAFGINEAGTITGMSATAEGVQHPFLWRNGRMSDLGTLGGPNAAATNATESNQVSVVAETVKTDPAGEDFCGFGTHRICVGAVWRDGKLTALSTLGGNNAIAFATNARGQIAGVAEKAAKRTTCPAPQVQAYSPVMWDADGSIHELPLQTGDNVGFAIGINDKGEAVGSTGECGTTTVSAIGLNFGAHATLWRGDKAVDLGTLGEGSTAVAINNRSEVVGGSVLEQGGVLGWLWTRDYGMRAIHPLGADAASLPTMINNSQQVVGASCNEEFECRAFVWERGQTMDLNEMAANDSSLLLVFAGWINDAGEIVGQAVDLKSGQLHAFLATPDASPAGSGQPKSAEMAPDVRSQIRQLRGNGRLGIPMSKRQ